MAKKRTLQDYLWPLGGTAFGLIVVPVAIAQYPGFFNENEWLLPLSVLFVGFCWLVPLLLHDRARRIYSRVMAIGRCGTPALLLLFFGIGMLFFLGGTKLLRSHRAHLQRLIPGVGSEAKSATTVAAPAPVPTTPRAHIDSATQEAISKVTFKDSPLFTNKRKARIERNIRHMDRYFKSIEIDVPVRLPRIGLKTKSDSNGTAATISPQTYQENIAIAATQIDDPKQITLAYSRYVVLKMLVRQLPPVPQDKDDIDKRDLFFRIQDYWKRPEVVDSNYRSNASMEIPTYLNWSFWNAKGKDSGLTCITSSAPFYFVPADFFWDIRKRYGHNFADQLVAYTLKTMRDSPHTDASEGFDAYFRSRLRQADSLIDNDADKFPEIESLLDGHECKK